MSLKTDYVNDVLDTSINTERTYNIVDANGNIVYEGVKIRETTALSTTGDNYGALEINEQNEVINGNSEAIEQINEDLPNKVANSTRVSNSILDINGSDLTLQGKVKNSQGELFAIVAYDTDKLKYLHTTDGGTTWTTIWEISPTALATQVGNINSALTELATQVGTNTTNINTVVNIGLTSVDANNFVNQGYSYAKALNNGHLVNVSLIYKITSSGTNDITIARLGGNYPTSPVFGTCYVSGNNAYPVYIDTNGYIHIQLDAIKTFSNNLLALNMTYLR